MNLKKIKDSAEKYLTLKQLISIANRAGRTVIDAKEELMELGASYEDGKIPNSRVKEILRNYDM